MKRRFTLLAVATFLSTTLLAAWEGGSSPFSGSGTEGDPYLIASEENLAYLASQVNSGTSYSGKHFVQTNDLDLGGVQDGNGVWSGRQWIPIGNNSKQFSGIYNGNGKIIENLYYNNPAVEYVGLFGGINNATLENITLASGFVYGYQYTGGICGFAKGYSTITYCANIATVYGKMERIGGILGQIDGTSNINNCINYGLVSAYNFAGGVVGGRNKKSVQTMEYCVNVGQVFTMRCSGNVYGLNNSGGGTTNYCFYDNQINTSEGWTTDSKDIQTNIDLPDHMEGWPTSQIIGHGLEDKLNNKWYFQDGVYPRLLINYNNPAIIAAATPIILNPGDKADSVTANFSVSTANNVTWTSANTDNLVINGNGTTTIKRSTAIMLIATKDGYTKKVYIKTAKTGATKIDSLTVESEEDLEDLRDAVNNYGLYKGCANYDGFKGIHFKQTVNIALTNWTEPIGVHSSFKGIYDGNNNSLSGININQGNLAIVGGLFGCASYGSIKNLSITSGTVTGLKDVGGLCGSTFCETISNCSISNSCTISTSTSSGEKVNIEIGGIVGVDKGFSTFTDCKNGGTVTGVRYAGGIMGRCNQKAVFVRCINSGSIESSYSDAGGICSNIISKDSEFKNCENYGTITSISLVGGIAGSQDSGIENCDFSNCINSGEINGLYNGGIIGQINGTVTINNCLNMGSVSGGNGIGGSSSSTISNCFNAGTANNAIASSGTITNCINIGNATSVPANCLFDNQLLIRNGSNGKKTLEMTGDALKATLGEENWVFNENMYPMPKGLENSDYMKVAATALILDENDDKNTVSHNFVVGTDNSVEWNCNTSNVTFVNGSGYISNPGISATDANVIVSVSIGNCQKDIPLTIKATGKDAPTMNWTNFTDSDDDGIADDINLTYGDEITADMLAVSFAIAGDEDKGVTVLNEVAGTILDAGYHTLSATYTPKAEFEDVMSSKIITRRVHVAKANANSYIEWAPQNIVYGESYESKIKNARMIVNGNEIQGTFTYLIPTLNAGNNQTVSLTFDSKNYATSAQIVRTINVAQADPTISWTIAPIEYGTPITEIQLGAFSSFGPITYQYKNGSSITLNEVLEIGNYTICATLVPTNPNYKTVTIEKTLAVTKATPVITWSNPSDISYGTALTNAQLNASANVPGTYSYSPDFNDVPDAGTNVTLHVDFTPTDQVHYKSTSAEVHINIGKVTPTITWNNSLEDRTIAYGTALSGTQLDASVSPAEAGTIAYTFDAAGTQDAMNGASDYNVGEYDIYATVAESDNFNSVQTSGKFKVVAATPVITWNPQNVTFGASDEEIISNIKNATASCNGTNWTDASFFTYEIPALTAGTKTVKVTFNPDDSNYKTVSDTTIIEVIQAEPTITWNQPETITITYGTALSAILLNATSTSDGTISYTLGSSTGTNAMDALLNVGEYTVYANIAESGNFTATSIHKSLNVIKADPEITWSNPADITYGTVLSDNQLNASSAAGSNFVYSLDAAGQTPAAGVTLDAGTHTIYATLPQSANYNDKQISVSIKVNKATPSISWTSPTNIVYGTALTKAMLDAAASSDSEGELSYSWDESGLENAIGTTPNAGNNIIYISVAATNNYTAKTEPKTLSIAKASPEITWTPQSIVYGTSLTEGIQLNATSTSDGAISYNIGTEDGANAINAILNAGNNTIYVTVAETQNYSKKVESRTLFVAKAEPTITWSNPDDIVYGTALSATQLNASSAAGSNFTYSLDAAGQNAALGAVLDAGTHTLYTTLPASENYTAKQASVTIQVSKAEPTITWTNPDDIVYGTLLSGTQLNATTDVAGSFSYSPEAGTKLNAGNNQSLTATFTPTDNNYKSATATVKINVAKAEPTITWSNPADIEYGTLLSGTQLNATADAAGSFSYSPAAGTKLNAGNNQTLTATFTPTDNNYNPATATVKINVAKATPTITWSNPADIEYGTLLSGTQLNATTDVAGSFSYSPAAGTKLNAGNNQTLTATFTPTDNNYNPTSASVTINVAKATPTITWSNPVDIVYGTLLSGTQLNATADAAGSFSYSPAAGTKLNAGNNQSLTATFTPTDNNYESATATVKINVAKATPTITWSNPADIVYGTLLSGTQLNATADAAGSFSYSPAAGTKLNAGNNQSLTATFTPTDNNYKSASATVKINVAKATPAITWSNPDDIVYGTALSGAQLNAESDAAGSFSYNPAAGTKLNAGNNQTLTATFNPTDKNYKSSVVSVKINVSQAEPTITWNNPDDIVYGTALSAVQLNAEVDAAGKLTYSPAAKTKLNAGDNQTLTVTFAPTDTKNYKTASASVTINVAQAEPVITWEKPADIVYGTALTGKQLNAEVNAAGKFTYSPSVGTKLNAGNDQTLTATFVPNDTKNYTTVSAEVKINVAKADAIITWNAPADIVYGTALANSMLNATANVLGTFEYTPAADAILNAGVQELSAVFTPADTANYNTASVSVQIGVAKADPVLAWSKPSDIVYGTPLADSMLNATANVLGDFEYTPAADAILNAGAQTLSAVFTPADTANYNSASTAVEIFVAKANPEIVWNNPSDIVYGTPIADSMLNASANVLGGFEYTPAADAILNAGVQELSAVFTPADTANYNSASATVEIVVAKANPEIVWNNPNDIVYGTALTDSILNASANVLGDFEYTPAADAILNAGVQVLSVVFTPADTANYNSASTAVEIFVAKANPEIVWNNPNDIVYGTALTDSMLNATANVLGDFEYTPAADSILTSGIHELSVVFTPADTANYYPASATAQIVVEKAEPIITWSEPNSIVYGTVLADSMLNATTDVEGVLTYMKPTDSVLNAGNYPIIAMFIAADSNYLATTDTTTLTVTKATLTVTAVDDTIMVGSEMSELQIAYSGFVFDDDTSSLTTLATATCNVPADSVGTFEIVVSGAEADNYTFEYVSGKLTVIEYVKPEIAWTIDVKSIDYGTPIDSTILNATSNIDGIFKYSVAVGDILNAGINKLTATFIPAFGGESVTDTVELYVNKVALSVKAADATINQGEEMPAFNLTYEGFVAGETAASLTTAPVATCEANTNEAGTYEIVVSGGESANYNFYYVNGTLTVKAKDDTTAIAETEVQLMAYPNPTNGMFVVETNSSVEYIYVYNSVGKLVATEMNTGTTRFNLTNEPEGTYFVKVGAKTLKIMKF